LNRLLGFYTAKIIGKLRHDKHNDTLNRWFAKQGVNLVGGNGWINICSNIAINEPHLITIGSNTTIAGHVEFVTHDNSISKVLPNTTALFGKITIGSNCFIGARSVIMYGVTIADNVIVASGSVVCNSVTESNVIVAGNPAIIISTWDRFKEKSKDLAWNLCETSREEMIHLTSQGYKVVRR